MHDFDVYLVVSTNIRLFILGSYIGGKFFLIFLRHACAEGEAHQVAPWCDRAPARAMEADAPKLG